MKSRRIITIGYQPENEDDRRVMESVVRWLRERGQVGLAQRFVSEDFDRYDMVTLPEKGDGIKAVRRYRAELVFAMHLFCIDINCDNNKVLRSMNGYHYNRENWKLLDICRKKRVPLIAWGDQPLNHAATSPFSTLKTQIVGSAYLYEFV